ncbi:GvpL/GvpF family gas vesicle protein [Streptomyces sp. NPDC001251]|uniref:GvpL/GvpF family gas vesicle protein n=1 Tax=Streptomyces sp. NPDC056132 TaxID=3345722 RepID=UPI001DFB73CC|nr:GvpL/GvpF family gas vesicle protein [Streptomyces sp. MAG02]
MSTYIYAILPADRPLNLDGLQGVGKEPTVLRTLSSDKLTAVVSEAPEDLRAKRRDVLAHQAVQERLLADGSVLPMRFGLVGPNDEAVLAELDAQADAYLHRLEAIGDCIEYNLKASRDESDLLREVVAESDLVRDLNERTRKNPQAQGDKVALGQAISQEVERLEKRDASTVINGLAPSAQQYATADVPQAHFLNVSFLVPRASAAEFCDRVDEMAKRLEPVFQLSLRGPLPPYSFV